MVDLPDPLAPRISLVCPGSRSKLTSFSTTLSSNASDTCSSRTTGSSAVAVAVTGAVVTGLGPEVIARQRQYIRVIRSRVMKKSTAITATDAATTALVVARPTPWVPPEVRSPT